MGVQIPPPTPTNQAMKQPTHQLQHHSSLSIYDFLPKGSLKPPGISALLCDPCCDYRNVGHKEVQRRTGLGILSRRHPRAASTLFPRLVLKASRPLVMATNEVDHGQHSAPGTARGSPLRPAQTGRGPCRIGETLRFEFLGLWPCGGAAAGSAAVVVPRGPGRCAVRSGC